MTDSIAKITRPTVRGMAARPRLFRRVDRLARQHPIVWVSAPAGSGKTTLAASWIAARHRPCLWYQLDVGDADAATFFYYQREAIGRLAPRRRETLPLLTPEYAPGAAAYARNFFEVLGARVPRGTVIVLDNYQDLPEDAPLQALLPQALSALPEDVRVLVLSRSAPPPSFARLITESVVGFLDGEELNLSAAETRALARARVGKRVEAAAAEAVRTQTGGWVVGTVLLLEAPARVLPPPRAAKTSAQQVLFDYFASEIFDRTPADTQRLLLATALLHEVSVPAAKTLAGEARAAEILADLVRRNYFTLRLVGHEPRYRYHPLFRDFLLATGRRLLSAERLSEIRREGARLLEETGAPDTAVDLFFEAGSFGDVARVALRHAPAMLAAGRAGTLSRWLERLPAEMLEEQPRLLYWLGLSIAPFRPTEGHRHLERCFELFRPGADAETLYSVWSSAASTYLYRWDTGDALTGWVSKWDELRRLHSRFPSPEIEEGVAPAIFAALVFTRPDHPELPHWKRRCIELVRAGRGQQRAAASALVALFCHLYWTGRHSEAGNVVNSLGSTSFATRDPLAIAWGSSKTLLHWLVESMSRAVLEEFEAVLDLARENGIHLWNFFINIHCACFADDLRIAEGFLREARRTVDPTDRLQAAHYQEGEALLALRRGDARRAVEGAELSIDLARQDCAIPFQFAAFRGRITLSLALVEMGDVNAAARQLQEARRFGGMVNGVFAEYLCSLAEAVLNLTRGEERDAIPSLRKAMAIGAANSIFGFPCFTRERIAMLCALSLAHGIEVDYVRRLIIRRELQPPDEAAFEERWPRALKVLTLGRFELWRDGERVSFGAKTPRRPLELLRALIALGGADVREEVLADALWPETEGDAAAHALETTVYRLRKLLGSPNAVIQQDGRITLDPRICWVDALALSRLLARALDLVTGAKADAAEVRREVERVLALYRGPLVPVGMAETDCAEAMRGRFRSQLSRFLHRAARQLTRAGEPEFAATYLARAREADPGLDSTIRSALVA